MADSRHAQDLQWQSLWECERAEPGINGLHQSKVFVTLCVTRHDVTRAHGEESGARDWLRARDGRDQAGQADQTRDLMRGNWTKWIKHWLTDGDWPPFSSLNPHRSASNWSEKNLNSNEPFK